MELSSPMVAAIIVGRLDRSTIRGMLSNSSFPDGPTSNMGIWPTVEGPAAWEAETGARGDKGGTVAEVEVVPREGSPRKTAISTSKLRSDTSSPNTSNTNSREVGRRGSSRGVFSS